MKHTKKLLSLLLVLCLILSLSCTAFAADEAKPLTGKTVISKKSAPCLAMQWRGALFPFFPLYSFITSLMKPSMRWALSCLIRSVKWAYLSRVKAAVAWPRLLWMVFISSPARIALTA